MAHTHHDILGLFQNGFAGLCPSTGLWTIEYEYQKGQVECPKGKKSGKQQTLPQLNYKKNRFFRNYKLDSTTKKHQKTWCSNQQNPESATTTTQFFNKTDEGSTHGACGGRGWFERQIFVSFLGQKNCDVILVQLGRFFNFFFQAPRVERLWAFQKVSQDFTGKSQVPDSWNLSSKDLTVERRWCQSLWKEKLTCAVLAELNGVDAILDVITQCCKLPLHFYSQFFKTHSVCQELVQEPWNDQCRVPRSHHVTHENRLSWMSPDSNHWEKAWNIAVWQHGATLGYPTTHWSDHLYPTQWRLWVSWTKSFQFH